MSKAIPAVDLPPLFPNSNAAGTKPSCPATCSDARRGLVKRFAAIVRIPVQSACPIGSMRMTHCALIHSLQIKPPRRTSTRMVKHEHLIRNQLHCPVANSGQGTSLGRPAIALATFQDAPERLRWTTQDLEKCERDQRTLASSSNWLADFEWAWPTQWDRQAS